MNRFTLMYHDIYISSNEESGFLTPGANYYKLPVDTFKQHLNVILKAKKKNNNITLTFDDGGCSFYEQILPLLEEYGLKGHFFISTNFIESKGFLSEEHLRKISKLGHVIGAHSCSHPSNISSLPKEHREREWRASIERLNAILGKSIDEISIPNGYFNTEDISLFRRLGIKTIYTSKIGEYRKIGDILIMGRIAITSKTSTSQLRNLLTKRYRLYLLKAQQTVIEIIKKLLGSYYILLKKKIRNPI